MSYGHVILRGGVVNRVQFTQLFIHNNNNFKKMNSEKVLVHAKEGLETLNLFK